MRISLSFLFFSGLVLSIFCSSVQSFAALVCAQAHKEIKARQVHFSNDEVINAIRLFQNIEQMVLNGATPREIWHAPQPELRHELISQKRLLQKALERAPHLEKQVSALSKQLTDLSKKESLNLDLHFAISLKTLSLLEISTWRPFSVNDGDPWRTSWHKWTTEKGQVLEQFISDRISAEDFSRKVFTNESLPIENSVDNLLTFLLEKQQFLESEKVGFLSVPIFLAIETPLSVMNQLMSPAVSLYGLTSKIEIADQLEMPPLIYAAHDKNHRRSIQYSIQEVLGKPSPLSFYDYIRIVLKVRESFLEQLAEVQSPEERHAMNMVLLDSWHEFSGFLVKMIAHELLIGRQGNLAQFKAELIGSLLQNDRSPYTDADWISLGLTTQATRDEKLERLQPAISRIIQIVQLSVRQFQSESRSQLQKSEAGSRFSN